MTSQINASETYPAIDFDKGICSMSNMPTRVQIGPIRYTVQEDADLILRKEHELHKKPLYGCVAWMHSQILVRPDQSECQKRDTLLHEVLHALDDAYKLFPQGDDGAEEITSKTATALLDALRRNPELVAYLMTEDE